MSVNIHGKEYVTVSERLELAKDQIHEIITELVASDPIVIVKARVFLKDGRITSGMSAANPQKLIEKESPVEVAETSAVGRALGFLGFGSTDSIASTDEVRHAARKSTVSQEEVDGVEHICQYEDCNELLNEAVVQFCLSNKGRFGGKVYCFDHQKKFASGLKAYAKGGDST